MPAATLLQHLATIASQGHADRIDEEEAKSPVAKKAISKTGGGNLSERVRGGCDGGERQLPGLPRALRRREPGGGRAAGARPEGGGGCGRAAAGG